jgi:hypothetical protein
MAAASVDVPDLNDLEVEDGSALAKRAWDRLRSEREALNRPSLEVHSLEEFLTQFPFVELTLEQKTTIVDQAILMFERLYPHLPFKKQLFNFVHPVETLQALRNSLPTTSEGDFHAFMIAACNYAVDTHTLYGVPPNRRGAVAFLPFQVRAYKGATGPTRFGVTRVMPTEADGSFGHPLFGPGATITHWNGSAAELYIGNSRDRFPAGFSPTRLARGAVSATIRPLTYCQHPDESEETVYYQPAGSTETHAIRFPWAVATGIEEESGIPTRAFSVSAPSKSMVSTNGILVHRDDVKEQIQNKATLEAGLGPSSFLIQPFSTTAATATVDLSRTSALPFIFDFQYTGGLPGIGMPAPETLRDEGHPNAKFGYLRIRSFSGQEMVEEFRRILSLMNEKAPDGLVLDIRGNPGGDIQSAERMPQMLTDRRIQPASYHLANTPAVQGLLRLLRDESLNRTNLTARQDAMLTDAKVELQEWIDHVEDSATAGGPLTTGAQLTSSVDANNIGRVYRGRSVLVTDVQSYSAADMFAAAYQDHEIGMVIGVDPATGGGGGNVWTHDDIFHKLPATPELPFAELPPGVTLTLAIRRCLRSGINSGVALEDFGVTPDLYYPADSAAALLDSFPGVIRHACRLLGAARDFRVRARESTFTNDGKAVRVDPDVLNVDRLSVQIDGGPTLSIQVTPGAPTPFLAPVDANKAGKLSISVAALAEAGFAMLPGSELEGATFSDDGSAMEVDRSAIEGGELAVQVDPGLRLRFAVTPNPDKPGFAHVSWAGGEADVQLPPDVVKLSISGFTRLPGGSGPEELIVGTFSQMVSRPAPPAPATT